MIGIGAAVIDYDNQFIRGGIVRDFLEVIRSARGADDKN
jgi:hypothetical protein